MNIFFPNVITVYLNNLLVFLLFCLGINQCFKPMALLQIIPFSTASVKGIFFIVIKSNTST